MHHREARKFAAVTVLTLQGAPTVNAVQNESHRAPPLHQVSQGHTRLKDKCTQKHKSCLVISTVILNDAQGKSHVISHQGTHIQHQALASHKRKEIFQDG